MIVSISFNMACCCKYLLIQNEYNGQICENMSLYIYSALYTILVKFFLDFEVGFGWVWV